MMQRPWFKFFIWFMATFFFFLASAVVISMFKPGPTEAEVMQFMMGMMSAMDSSMMGVLMNIEHNGTLQAVIALSAVITAPVIAASLIIGFGIRLMQRRSKNA